MIACQYISILIEFPDILSSETQTSFAKDEDRK